MASRHSARLDTGFGRCECCPKGGNTSKMVRRGTRSRIALVAYTVGMIAGTLAVAASAADRVYWGGYGASTPRISFANLDGSGGGDLNSGLATVDEPFGIAIDLARGRILWANDGGSAISFANLNNTGGGGNLNTSGVSVYDPEGIAIDPAIGRVYWTNTPGGPDTGVSFANLNNTGGGRTPNTDGATVDHPLGLGIDPIAGKIYWANDSGPDQGIWFANLDNTGGGGKVLTGMATVDGPAFATLLERPRSAAA